MTPRQNPLAGMLYMTVAMVFFGAMHVAVRHATQSLHPFEAAFFRNLFGLFVVLPTLARGGFAQLRTERFGLHLLRAAMNVAAMLLFFYSLSITPVALVQALSFTSPMFTAILAVFLLGERIRARRIMAIVVGFAGALIIIRPGVQPIELGPVLAVVSAAIWGLTMIVIKVISRTDSAVVITSYMVLLMTPISGAIALFVWTWPGPEQLLVLMLIGVLGTVAQLLMSQALRVADMAVVLPIDFTKLVWGGLLAWVVFGEVVDGWTWFGGAIIFAGTLYLAFRERQVRMEAEARQGGARPQ